MEELRQSINKITEEHFSKMRTIISENQKQIHKLFERCLAVVNDGAGDTHPHADPHVSASEQSDNADPDADVLSDLEFVEDENGLNAEIDETDVVSAEQKNSKTPVSALGLFDESPKKNGERYFVWCKISDEQKKMLDCVHDTYKLDLEGNDLVYNSRIVSTFGAFPRVKLKFNVLFEVIALIRSNGICSSDHANAEGFTGFAIDFLKEGDFNLSKQVHSHACQFGLCFLARLFSSISSIKASYAEMQLAQCPYDSEIIQSADEMVVSELKILSEMKQCYFKQQVDEFSPETTQLLAELKEQKSLTKTLQIMEKNLESEYQLKQYKLTFVREKLEEALFEQCFKQCKTQRVAPVLRKGFDELRDSVCDYVHLIFKATFAIIVLKNTCLCMGSTDKNSYGAYTYEALEREPYWPSEKLRISITGVGGFIASHIVRRLKSEGHYIIASDWKKNEHMPEDMFCHEFHLVDLRVMKNCLKVSRNVDHVFNLAADMGGMGFIQSNHWVIMYNNTMISFNMLEAGRISGVKRLFYASSACICPEFKQLETNVSLKESDAWPAEPQDAYGLEKLATEELCKHYTKDFGIVATQERDALYLRGLLPPVVLSQDLQVKKLMHCIRQYEVPLQRYMAMLDFQERNTRLFYKLLIGNVEELLPVVYTLTVGDACEKYGSILRRLGNRGLKFLSSLDFHLEDKVLFEGVGNDTAQDSVVAQMIAIQD